MLYCMLIIAHAIKHIRGGKMVSLILLATSFLLVNLATLKIEMSDGSFYRPVAETIICTVVIVVCFML